MEEENKRRGNIALLVSREEMLHQAHNILQEKAYEIGEMKVIRTEDAVSEARRSSAAGASIIIARGLQASLIKQYTDIPVVEIVITAQEMALLVIRAKQILKKPNPVIGVVGFQNMFCDMSYFDMIYEIDLRTYYAERGAELGEAASRAVQDQVDLIIGGDTAVLAAGEAGIPSLFLSITEDSLRNALSVAERMGYAMNMQKRNEAQMETLLDYSFSGITRMDAFGYITDINPMMEDILEKKRENVLGKTALEIFGELDGESLRQVLEDGSESYSLFMQLNKTSVFAILAPVLIEGRVDGVMMTCHRMKKRKTMEQESQSKRHSRGFIALGEFGDIMQKSKAMQECVRMAKLCALSDKPVLIMGEAGTEKRLLAQSIHNASAHAGGPFVDVSCEGVAEDMQLELIFGDKGAVAQANGGTVLLEDICFLTKANQYRLYQLIRYKLRVGKDVTQYPGIDVRVMVTTRESLASYMHRGMLREDLYYLLEGLTIRVPSLRERPEDLETKLDCSISDCCEHYSRYHVLTQGAREKLMEYPWNGNLFQVENFCERLILMAQKRSLDETTVVRTLRELYPDSDCMQGHESVEQMSDIPEEARQISQMLLRMSGSREKTASALGISKATLWRKMKKYDLE